MNVQFMSPIPFRGLHPPLIGGRVYFYDGSRPELNLPKTVFADEAMTTAQTNPVILDSNGAAEIHLGDGLYSVTVTDHEGAVIWSVDHIERVR